MSEGGDSKTGLSTRCVHSGERRDPHGAIHPPLYNHSTFGFGSAQELLDVVEGRAERSLYTRYGLNPTLRAVEEKIAAIEIGERCLVFGSGMAAESATFLAHCHAESHIICIGDVYGGTQELLEQNLPHLHIETTFVLANEVDALDDLIRPSTRLVFFETPTNPRLEVLDIAKIAKVARRRGVLTVVDSTFATPVNQNPLELGADLVVHSTTKYMGGHSDLTGGAVVGPRALLEPIWVWRKNLGQTMAPEVAFALLRSLRTLVVRVRAQNAAAQLVAERLAKHPRVKMVNYPGLESAPSFKVARGQMMGFGGMVSFTLDGDAAQGVAFADRLRLFTIAPSLGAVESLVCLPAMASHHGLTSSDRARRGISDGLVRLSCGLEDPEDLWRDIEQALNSSSSP